VPNRDCRASFAGFLISLLLVWLPCLTATPAAAEAVAETPNLQAPGGGAVEVSVTPGDRVEATSDYWRLRFDLHNGGALSSIVFRHGSGRNVLLKPFRTYVDDWETRYAPATRFTRSGQGSVVRLEFSGGMAKAGGENGPLRFHTTWTLSPYVVRADHQIEFTRDLEVRTVGIGSTVVRAELDEYGWRTGPADDPGPRKMCSIRLGKAAGAGSVLIREHHAPVYLLFFDRGVEGFDFQTASDLASWETGLTGRGGVGRYEAVVRKNGTGIRIRREPLEVPHPIKVPKGVYTFSYYLGLPRIMEESNRKWRHLSFNNHPWPSEEEIQRWADNGVNLVRLHNDYAEDGNFWHDGAWPPYDEQGMKELRRVIAACHRHGIRVVPYFSMQEFHPQARGYQEYEQEWKRTADQAGTVFHNHRLSGEFGAQMCLLSGWRERRKKDVETAYRELGFDGIYYDWMTALPCNNQKHRAGLHLGTDGVIDLLAWTRRLIGPDGVLILHSSGWRPSITFENFGDLVVNMENLSSAEGFLSMEDIPITGVLGESVPRSPCPTYRRDRARERTRNRMSLMAVLGLFPWSGNGGPVYEETLQLFHAFQPYRLEDYRLHDALSGAVQTGWEDVYGAVYTTGEKALVVLSNTNPQARKNVVWRVNPRKLELGSPATVVLKDTVSGTARKVPFASLTDGSQVTTLASYEYRLFEIQPAP